MTILTTKTKPSFEFIGQGVIRITTPTKPLYKKTGLDKAVVYGSTVEEASKSLKLELSLAEARNAKATVNTFKRMINFITNNCK